MSLSESQPKVLFSQAPMMMLVPCEQHKQETFPHYECPLYRCGRGVVRESSSCECQLKNRRIIFLLLPSFNAGPPSGAACWRRQATRPTL